jgi:hypothetical protein
VRTYPKDHLLPPFAMSGIVNEFHTMDIVRPDGKGCDRYWITVDASEFGEEAYEKIMMTQLMHSNLKYCNSPFPCVRLRVCVLWACPVSCALFTAPNVNNAGTTRSLPP